MSDRGSEYQDQRVALCAYWFTSTAPLEKEYDLHHARIPPNDVSTPRHQSIMDLEDSSDVSWIRAGYNKVLQLELHPSPADRDQIRASPSASVGCN